MYAYIKGLYTRVSVFVYMCIRSHNSVSNKQDCDHNHIIINILFPVAVWHSHSHSSGRVGGKNWWRERQCNCGHCVVAGPGHWRDVFTARLMTYFTTLVTNTLLCKQVYKRGHVCDYSEVIMMPRWFRANGWCIHTYLNGHIIVSSV